MLFNPTCQPHVFMMMEIKRAFENLRVELEIFAYHLEEWYALPVISELKKQNIQYSGYERKDKSDKGYWLDKNSKELQRAELPEFEKHFKKELKKINPDFFVVMTDDGIFESSMIRYCKEEKVRSVFTQEAYIPDNYLNQTASKKKNGLKNFVKDLLGKNPKEDPLKVKPFGLNGSDYIAAINENDAEWFKKNGIPARNIFVTGHILMDRLFNFKKAAPPSEKSSEKTILFISSGLIHFGFTEPHMAFLNSIRDFAGTETGKKFNIRLRLKPGEKIELWENDWPEIKNEISIADLSQPLYHQIKDSDIVVSNNSQANMEALMMDKIVVNLVPKGTLDPFKLYETSALIYAATGEEMEAKISSLREFQLNENQKAERDKNYNEHFYYFDGRAAARFAENILRIRRFN